MTQQLVRGRLEKSEPMPKAHLLQLQKIVFQFGCEAAVAICSVLCVYIETSVYGALHVWRDWDWLTYYWSRKVRLKNVTFPENRTMTSYFPLGKEPCANNGADLHRSLYTGCVSQNWVGHFLIVISGMWSLETASAVIGSYIYIYIYIYTFWELTSDCQLAL